MARRVEEFAIHLVFYFFALCLSLFLKRFVSLRINYHNRTHTGRSSLVSWGAAGWVVYFGLGVCS